MPKFESFKPSNREPIPDSPAEPSEFDADTPTFAPPEANSESGINPLSPEATPEFDADASSFTPSPKSNIDPEIAAFIQNLNSGDQKVTTDSASTNSEYIGDGVMSVSQEEVETHPERYILPECIPACKALWDKNIYTFMTSNHGDIYSRWVQFAQDDLSPENHALFEKLAAKQPANYHLKDNYRSNVFTVVVEGTGEPAGDELLSLVADFQMQDVPEGVAYLSLEDFLILYDNCYDEVPNPNYRPMQHPALLQEKVNAAEYLKLDKEYEEWLNSEESHETIRKFNPQKQTTPTAELVARENMILDGNRVYLSDFHYQKHLAYANSAS